MDSRTAPPAWELHHRLARSLEWARHMKPHEMAEYLGCHRNTISNYLSGRTVPTPSVIRDWAARCEVPVEWLRDGDHAYPADRGAA